MSTTKGSLFNILVAVIPPAIAFTGHHFHWTSIINLSPTSKIVFTILYILVIYQTAFKYFTSPFRFLPAPPNIHFFLGHTPGLVSRPPGAAQLRWMTEVPNDGLIVIRGVFHLGSNLLLTTPETIMSVLNTHSYDWEKPALARRFLRRVLGNGLVNVEGNEHKQQRRNVTPAFSGKHIKDLVPLFWSKALSLAHAVKTEAASNKDSAIEVSSLASRATLDIIGSAGIGRDFNTTEHADHELAQQYEKITNPNKGYLPLYFLVNAIFPQWMVRKLPLEANRRVANAVFSLRQITGRLLSEKIWEVDEEESDDSAPKPKDIIAILMRSGNFSNEGLTDQLLTFLAAGHETTASSLTWALYLLSKHPDIQTRLRTECLQTFSDSDSTTTTSATLLDSAPYLEAICSEVLRIYPVVPGTTRVANKPTQIGSTSIPKGTYVFILPWAINRLPSLWGPDAAEFRPERWLEGKNGGASSPYAFLTFLHGPRSCIGQSFARYELKCLLAVLIMRFEFSERWPERTPVPDGMVSIKPRDGMELIVRELS